MYEDYSSDITEFETAVIPHYQPRITELPLRREYRYLPLSEEVREDELRPSVTAKVGLGS